jgi:hypothetical protein
MKNLLTFILTSNTNEYKYTTKTIKKSKMAIEIKTPPSFRQSYRLVDALLVVYGQVDPEKRVDRRQQFIERWQSGQQDTRVIVPRSLIDY